MNANTVFHTTIAALAAVVPLTAMAAPQVYDLRDDWSDTQNPNGAWEYRLASGLGGLLSNDPFPWAHEEEVVLEGYDWETNTPYTYTEIQLTAIARTTAADAAEGFLEPGDIYTITEGSDPYVHVHWTAPADGSIDLSGAVWQQSTGYVGCDWRLYYWGSSWSAISQNTWDGPNGWDDFDDNWWPSRNAPLDFSTGPGGPDALLNIPVQAGDRVLLELGSNQTPAGVNFTVTFTPEVVDPVTAIEDLALAVVEMNLQNGIENSLDSKLDAALEALSDVVANNDGTATNTLQAFINAVEAQRGNKLTEAQADQLIAAAQEIQDLLLAS
jgi:hypothetical protein